MQQGLRVDARRIVAFCLPLALAGAGCSGSIGGKTGGATQSPGGGPTAEDPKAGDVVPAVLVRRLSLGEIDNTLEDVLGDTTRPAQQFLLDEEFRPYDNDYTLQASSSAFTDAVRELAKGVAARAVSTAATRAVFMPCQPQGAGDTACFRQTIAALGRRLLRRPLGSAEVDAYATLQKYATEVNTYVKTDFYTGVGLLVRALVQDPEFLHRVESGRPTKTPNVFALDSYEVATRMSYLLWGSSPDPMLLDAAGKALLVTPEGRAAELDRMLKAPRARSQLHRFHAMWLGYRTLPHPADVTSMFNQETTTLLNDVIFDSPSSYFDVFTSDRTFLTTQLAQYYGLPAPAGGKGWVTYDGKGRGGILSHGAVLAAFSKFSDTSPTQRGILVQTRLLCNQISNPPANVDVDKPPGMPDQQCKTDRYRAHMDQSGCRECHGLMDPIGFGLENFDIGGRWRDTDNGKPQCPIAGQGDLPGVGPFSGPKQLADGLLGVKKLQECVVKQYLSFALGRALDAAEAPMVASLQQAMGASGDQLVALLRQLVSAPGFALRMTPEAP